MKLTNRCHDFWPDKGWWLALVLILVVGGILRYTGYDFSLPYVDHPDEPAALLAAAMILDRGTAEPLGFEGYPPGILFLDRLILMRFWPPGTPPGTVLGLVRLIAITVSVATIILVGLLGFRISTPLSGLVGAGFCAVAPVLVEHSRYATADPFATFLTLLALWLSISGTLFDRDSLILSSTIAIMLAIAFKYQAVGVAPIVTLLPLWRWRTFRDKHRRILVALCINAGALLVFGYWLGFVYPSQQIVNAPHSAASPDQLAIPTLGQLQTTLVDIVAKPLLPSYLWLLGLVGGVSLAWKAVRQSINGLGAAAVLVSAAIWFGGVSLFPGHPFRQYVSAGLLLLVLAGAGCCLWVALLGRLFSRWRALPSLQASRIAAAAVVAVCLLGDLGYLRLSIENAREHTLPDRRNELAWLADTSLSPGLYISDADNHKTFSDAWGGYRGRHVLDLYQMSLVTDRPLGEWRAAGVQYAILPYGTFESMQTAASGQAYLDGMLFIKQYPPSDEYRGPAMVLFRLTPMQSELGEQLGPVHLIGYDLDRAVVAPGDSITFTLYWRSDAPLDGEYRVLNRLVDLESGQVVAQIEGSPHPRQGRTTREWTDPGETIISPPFTMIVGADVARGRYQLVTGFYRLDGGTPLRDGDGREEMPVTLIEVVARVTRDG